MSSAVGRGPSLPADFLWGAATAAHQVEGGNCGSDWWQYEQSGRLPHASGAACEQYARYESDFDMARGMGHNCHRLSVEWSRIEPLEGRFDPEALQHYARLMVALRDRGLEPVVTLQHFTLPAWLASGGGWLRNDAPALFARYAARVVERLGPLVTYWLTVNEPTVLVSQAYLNGTWPPMERGQWVRAGRALRQMAKAHVAAYESLKSGQPAAHVSFAHNALWMEPCDPRRALDRIAARARDYVYNTLFFRLIGAVPGRPRHLDYVGLNYYTRCCVRYAGGGPTALLGRACRLEHHADPGARSDVGWEVYPKGLAHVLDRYRSLELPMFVTENGIATGDDDLRCEYIERHLDVVARAIGGGVQVIGYLHWSLLDNFEWDRGTEARFGLAATDYTSQVRTPRRSARVLAQICKSNRI